jgi:hypothetical protein
MKNLRLSTEKHYREMTTYSFYKIYDNDIELKSADIEPIEAYTDEEISKLLILL